MAYIIMFLFTLFLSSENVCYLNKTINYLLINWPEFAAIASSLLIIMIHRLPLYPINQKKTIVLIYIVDRECNSLYCISCKPILFEFFYLKNFSISLLLLLL